ncbi:MAG: O-methyltransferase [Sphingomonadales bacterium]
MSRGSFLNDTLYDYLLNATLAAEPLLDRLRDETTEVAGQFAGMQISRDQGRFMQVLVKLMGARRYLEVGTFTGYSSLVVAQAMPADGRLVCCDISEEWTAVARRYWAESGVEGKVDLRIAPALETMAALAAGPEAGSFDMIFIDGDKKEYDGYYEGALKLLRPGGVVLVDNVLWHGQVADPSKQDEGTSAIRALNEKVRDDARVYSVLVSIGDGLTLAVKL